jgi:hypothetical protein
MEHSLIMLVYNIKRSINILGVSDLIINKNGTPLQSKSLFFVYITNYFKALKTLLKSATICCLKTACSERLYCRLEYVLFVKLSERVFHS